MTRNLTWADLLDYAKTIDKNDLNKPIEIFISLPYFDNFLKADASEIVLDLSAIYILELDPAK